MTLLTNARIVLPDGVRADGWLRLDGHRIAEVGPAGSVPEPSEHRPARGVRETWPDATCCPASSTCTSTAAGARPSAPGTSSRRCAPRPSTARTAPPRPSPPRSPPSWTTCSATCPTWPGWSRTGCWPGCTWRARSSPSPAAAPTTRPCCACPDPALLRPLLAAGRGTVKMVTLAPELDFGIEATALLANSGVIAAVGHTDGGYGIANEAFSHGARVATHLFNAMPGVHHREPGPGGRRDRGRERHRRARQRRHPRAPGRDRHGLQRRRPAPRGPDHRRHGRGRPVRRHVPARRAGRGGGRGRGPPGRRRLDRRQHPDDGRRAAARGARAGPADRGRRGVGLADPRARPRAWTTRSARSRPASSRTWSCSTTSWRCGAS